MQRHHESALELAAWSRSGRRSAQMAQQITATLITVPTTDRSPQLQR